jgi:hypothetical protein
MPFREYALYFSPEQLAVLTAAFDASWEELSARPDLSTEAKIALMKKKLAQRILVAATAWRRQGGEDFKGTRSAEPWGP